MTLQYYGLKDTSIYPSNKERADLMAQGVSRAETSVARMASFYDLSGLSYCFNEETVRKVVGGKLDEVQAFYKRVGYGDILTDYSEDELRGPFSEALADIEDRKSSKVECETTPPLADVIPIDRAVA